MEFNHIFTERFKTLESLIDTMEERPANKAFLDKEELSSQKIYEGARPWAGTKDYNEAMTLVKKGYSEPLNKMKKAILKVGRNDNYKRPKMENDFVGFIPHVPNTVMGLPQTMSNKRPQNNKAKTIHIAYSFCVSAKVKPNELIEAGINIISLINSLEKKGYSVKLDGVFATTEGKSLGVFIVNLKEYGQKLNLLKLSFPLVQPSMLRRVAFKWLETTPDNTNKTFQFGYGINLAYHFNYSSQLEREELVKHGLLRNDKNLFFTNAYDCMRAPSIEALAKRIGIK